MTRPGKDLMAEANHRISNHLMMVGALVRQQSDSIAKGCQPATPEEVLAVLREVEARIAIVGRLHRLLAEGQQAGVVNLGVYLKDVAETAVSSFGCSQRTVLSHTSSADCTVSSEQALLIGLIVGELVTNSLKYAHPTGVAGKIRVGCRTVGTKVSVQVEDDGVGFPEGFDPMTQGNLGLRLVRSLAKQLGAKPVFPSSDIGLTFSLEVPEPGPRRAGIEDVPDIRTTRVSSARPPSAVADLCSEDRTESAEASEETRV
jgi:two-component sensor histidine kinase